MAQMTKIDPCPKCGRTFKSKSGKTLHEKKCDVQLHGDLASIKTKWDVTSIAVALGDIHDPGNKPIVVVYGERCPLTEKERQSIHANPDRTRPPRVYFRAIVSDKTRKVYYCTKGAVTYNSEIETILDNWIDFVQEDKPTSKTIIGRCFLCEARKVPGTYVNYAGICVFCMLKAVNSYMDQAKF